jgi:phosphoribosylanthranilate isomerase
MTTLKICGIQTPEVLQSMVHLPVDYIGFVFAKSRRQVTAEQANNLIAAYREQPHTDSQPAKFAGVFVNPSLEELDAILATVQLDMIQLHGQETANYCAEVKARYGVEVFKAFPAPAHATISPEQLFRPYLGIIDGALLDTVLPGAEGGTGVTFDWTILPSFIAFAKAHALPLLIAGGLQPGNVTDLIDGYEPFGVDVSSGVETDGVKDSAKIAQFVERVKHG